MFSGVISQPETLTLDRYFDYETLETLRIFKKYYGKLSPRISLSLLCKMHSRLQTWRNLNHIFGINKRPMKGMHNLHSGWIYE